MADAEQCALHFVRFIHGAFHGAWAWYRLEDALQKAGFNVSSMDMAGAGIHPADPDTVITWEEYHKPALDFFASLPERAAAPHEKVVLVGHSMAGFANLMLMERFPHKIDLVVFVAALVVPSGVPFSLALPLRGKIHKNVQLRYQNGTENAPTSAFLPPSKMHSLMYNGLDPEEITMLALKLVRPYPTAMLATTITYTRKPWPSTGCVHHILTRQHTPLPAQDYIAMHYGPFREVVHLDGGHFDFLQRLKEFTNLLTRLANQYIYNKQ